MGQCLWASCRPSAYNWPSVFGKTTDLSLNSDSELACHTNERLLLSSTLGVSHADDENEISVPGIDADLSNLSQTPSSNSALHDPQCVVSSGSEHSPSRKTFENPANEIIHLTRGNLLGITPQDVVNVVHQQFLQQYIAGKLPVAPQKAFDSKAVFTWRSPSLEGNNDCGVGYVCRKGLKPDGPNQDDFLVLQTKEWALYGVFDGHGPYGHDISNFVQKILPFLIITDCNFDSDPTYVIKQAFKKAHNFLELLTETSENNIDCTLSGTTATIMLQRGDELIVAYVGDSRCVLATEDHDVTIAQNLSKDHKPTRPDECRRIEAYGGEVRQLEGDLPYRVFARNRLYPGLAMSRALGDTIGSAFGIISEPEITRIELEKKARFIIIATDGIWEFISSEEAVSIVSENLKAKPKYAAAILAREAWKRWIQEEENVVDDVTCIVIKLAPP